MNSSCKRLKTNDEEKGNNSSTNHENDLTKLQESQRIIAATNKVIL